MVNLDDAVIARLESHGFKFEILVDPKLAADFKKQETQININDILAIETIFKDSKKGDKASEEGMNKVFETTDTLEVAKQIINKGTIQLTAQQKKAIQQEKHKKVVAKIAREAINPQNGLPHPINRIEKAMEESKIKIDPFKSVDEQVKIVLKEIRKKIPIRFEKVKIAVMLPNTATGKANQSISKFGTLIQEEWQQDGSWIGVVEIPGGLQNQFIAKMNEISSGAAEIKTIK